MKLIYSLTAIFVILCADIDIIYSQQCKMDNPVFVFNNAFNRRDIPYNEIAEILYDLGYDGIEHREIKGLFELKEELNKYGLKLFTDYVEIDLDKEQPYLEEWHNVLPKLKGSDLILWVHIHSERFEPSDTLADSEIVPILQELADLANPYGIRIAIYPHVNLIAETPEDSYRLAKLTNRDNVGAVFNLPHFLRTDKEENLESVLKKVTPALFAVSITGADKGNTKEMSWDRLIQPVGEGSFDTYKVVKLLLDNGYEGPIGIQCYNIEGDPRDFLKTSMDSWQHFKSIYEEGHNSLTDKEIANGWKLLFDGYSTDGWRGITKDHFPRDGWIIKNGQIRIDAMDGAESGNGGDIITKEEFGDFELKWEWRMLTKGGNSGIKYYVKEELTDNRSYGYGLEYQILDDQNHSWMLEGKMKPNDYHTAGALYEFFPPSKRKQVKPLGEWNSSKIVSKNNHIEHWLNGEKILEYKRGSDDFMRMLKKSKFKHIHNFGMAEKGHILIQDHGSNVHFRNIKINEF